MRLIIKNKFNKFNIFVILNFIVILNIINYFNENIDLYPISYLILSVVILISLVFNKNKLTTIVGVYFFILFLTLIPITEVILGVREYLYSGNFLRVSLHTHEYLHKTFFVILFQMSLVSTFLFLSKEINYPKYKSEKFNKILWVVIIVILSYLSNPTHMITAYRYGADDFSTGGSFLIAGWAMIFLIAFSYYAFKTKLKANFDVIFSIIIIIFWLLHGNRSEILGIVALLFLLRYDTNTSLKIKLKWVVLLTVLGASFQIIGVIRGLDVGKVDMLMSFLGGDFSLIFDGSSFGIPHISTVTAIDYSLLSIIYSVDEGHLNYHYGLSVFDYLMRTLPAGIPLPFERPVDLAALIAPMTNAKGGAHFAGEAYWNGSILGVYIFTFLVMSLITYFNNKMSSNTLVGIFGFALIMLAPRVVWYGNIYLYKVLLVFIILLIISKVKKISVKN